MERGQVFKLKVAMLGFLVSGASHAASAGPTDQWLPFIRACEASISEQSIRPLEAFEAAPFPLSFNKPGLREVAVFDRESALLAVARAKKEVWVSCKVQVREDARGFWRGLSILWRAAFERFFPEDRYLVLRPRGELGRSFPRAVRCEREGADILISPMLGVAPGFGVSVEVLPAWHAHICDEKPAG